MPKVSVIIPSFNSGKYIEETLLSVLVQDFQDFEIIVVDDASTDNTKDVIESLNCHKIKFIKLDKNYGGPSKPRNTAIAASNGKYIAMCDSDDIMMPGRLGEAVDVLDNNQILGLVFSDAIRFDDVTGVTIGRYLDGYNVFEHLQKKQIGPSNFEILQSDAYNALFYENYINTASVTIPIDVFKDIGMFDEDLTNGDDRDMWFRITRKYPIGYINLPCMKYRSRQGSISRRGAILADNRIKVLRKQLEHDLSVKQRKRINFLIAQNLYGIGYYYRLLGDFKKARYFYSLSIKTNINWASVKGFMASLLGYKLILMLRGK